MRTIKVMKVRINARIFFLKLLKLLLAPIIIIRNMIKKSNLRHLKIIIVALGLISCIMTILLYYWNHSLLTQPRTKPRLKTTTTEKYIHGSPMIHVPLNELYQELNKGNNSFEIEDIETNMKVNMINTPGCKIPVAMIDYQKYLKYKKSRGSCGRRAVFLYKKDRDQLQVYIRDQIMKQYLRKASVFNCCYRFQLKHTNFDIANRQIKYTACKNVQNLDFIALESDFVNVKCSEYDERNVSHVIYNDYYAFTKKIENINYKQRTCNTKYNVLLIGMDSMSLPRVGATMPRTVWHLKENFWLGYRGYHKVEDNTFPNLMAVLTGKNLSTILTQCLGRMDQCQDTFIWNKFKEHGYVTAYGEDYLGLPDTFTKKYAFQEPPTDHYMRPFYINREEERNNKSLICTGKVASGQQLLNYALDFVNTYKKENFFGLFWLNSFSHNINSRPQDADKMFESFFNELAYTGILSNTFVVFFSDHGLRFGEQLWKMESYYDNRMPFLFMWVPTVFKSSRSLDFRSLVMNQFRLVTPYDLFNTLIGIRSISVCSNSSEAVSEGCIMCHSMFNVVSSNRTCRDVNIHEKWCSCHYFHPSFQDTETEKSVSIVIAHIKSIIKAVETKTCWGCMDISLKNVIRNHFYYNSDKSGVYYVVALTVTPGNVSYEATVLQKGDKIEIIGPISVISPYRGLGKCTVKRNDRLFCLCQKLENC